MSPRHSGYRNEEFGFDLDSEFTYRAAFEVVDGNEPPSPANGPSRASRRVLRRKTSRKSPINGMQRRRNKHWTW